MTPQEAKDNAFYKVIEEYEHKGHKIEILARFFSDYGEVRNKYRNKTNGYLEEAIQLYLIVNGEDKWTYNDLAFEHKLGSRFSFLKTFKKRDIISLKEDSKRKTNKMKKSMESHIDEIEYDKQVTKGLLESLD